MEDFASRAGSHAGRGFRYQDAAGALLAVRCWTGDLPYGAVIPEGLDDYELSADAAFALVQAKSRREHLGRFTVGEAVGFVRELWTRCETTDFGPGELILLLEQPVSGGPDTDHRLKDDQNLAAQLLSDARWDALAPRTKIWTARAPFEVGVTAISETMRCPPLAAQVYFGELLRKIGDLANANGLVKDRRFERLTVSDIESTLRHLQPLLDSAEMEAALRDGYCDAVDFLTPIHDSAFYQGVDARPGHLAAGLVAERPEARRPVLDALEKRGSALIVGPSGVGKSALMWDVARTARHTVRWFEIRRGTAGNAHLLTQLARILRASPASPIGFVLDDVGRGFADLWDSLSRDAAGGGGVVLLGSIREEDVFLLPSRSRSVEIRPPADEAVAERIWAQLSERGETSSAGWREAWMKCNGLLLEFTHILTRGDRLEAILGEQVGRRLREHRDTELSALGVTALAGAAGALVDVTRLASALNVSADDLARALQRLVDEHLIAVAGAGVLGGLHQLRSATLLRLRHQTSPPLSQTVVEAVHAATGNSLGPLAAYIGARHSAETPTLIEALVARLRQDRDPLALLGALSGLGQAHVEATLERWIPEAVSFGLEPTQVTAAVLHANAGTDLRNPLFPDRLRNSVEALKTRSVADPRLQLLSVLPQSAIHDILERADAVRLRALLGTLVGLIPPKVLLGALERSHPDLECLELAAAADLLSAVRLLDRDTAIRWTGDGVRERLLARVSSEIPWAAAVEAETAPEGPLLRSAIYHVAPSAQVDVHEQVVQLCDLLFGLDPTVEIVAVDAVAADGRLSGLPGFPLASKRMPRENAPPSPLPQWNRRWLEAAARLIGAESYTDYLQRARSMLERLAPALERGIDALLRGGKSAPPKVREEILSVHAESAALTPPREGPPSGGELQVFVTPLQTLLFFCSSTLTERFAGPPERSAAFVYWCGELLKHAQDARAEPWDLIGRTPDDLLERLEETISALRLLSAEAGARNAEPTMLWKGMTKDAQRGRALSRVKTVVDGRLRAQSSEYLKRLQDHLGGAGILVEFHARPNWDEPLPWPTLELLGFVDLASPKEWMFWSVDHGPTIRATAGEGRRISLVPRVDGLAVTRLTVGGVSTLFPSPYAVDDWIDALGQRRLRDALGQAAQTAIDHLVELDGVRRLELEGSGRPTLERAILKQHQRDLSDALFAFETLAEGRPIRGLVRKFAEDVLARKIALAEAVAALTHGQQTSGFAALLDLSMTLLDEDLALAR